MPKPVKPRFENLEAANAAGLTGENYNTLKGRLNQYLFNNMGIQLDEHQKAPSSNIIIPRLQYLGTDPADGVERFQNINDTPFTPGSKEFFDQVMMGNIYAYPTGSPNPVQLQVDLTSKQNGGFTAKLSASDPISPEQLPARSVTAPSFFTKIWARIPFLGRSAKRRVDAYDAAQKAYNNAKIKLTENAETRAKTSQQEKDELVVLKDKAAKKEKLKDAEQIKNQTDICKQRMVDIFKPACIKRPDLMKQASGHPLGGNYSYCTEKDYRDLTILTNDEEGARKQLEQIDKEIEQKWIKEGKEKGLPEEQLQNMHPSNYSENKPYKFQAFDQNSIQIGQGGNKQPLTDAQFSAVALAAYWDPKHLKNGSAHTPNFDPTMETAFINMGYSKEDALEMSCCSQRAMGTTDFFQAQPRDNGGTAIAYFDPARKEAAEAFEAYKNHDKQPLAKLLAGGVNRFAFDFKSVTGQKLPDQVKGTAVMGEELLNLMKQDPELKALALQNGMKEKNLQALTGMVKIHHMERKAEEASYAIAKARLEGRELSTAQKAEYAKQLVMPKLAMLDMVSQSTKTEQDPKSHYYGLTNNLLVQPAPRMKGARGGEVPVPKDQRPVPEKGKVYMDSVTEAGDAVRMVAHPLLNLPVKLSDPAEERKFEQMAEQIVKNEKLDQLSNDDLFKAVGEKYTKINLAAASEKLKPGYQPPAPQVKVPVKINQNQVEKQEQGPVLGGNH